MKYTEILTRLQGLDLSSRPAEEINQLLGAIGPVAAIKTRLDPGRFIIRARPNYNGERFTKVSQISYKPAEFNKTYQRASTPSSTMFYGGILGKTVNPDELSINRLIGLFESLPFVRDIETSGEQIITFSKWEVVKPFELISVIHHKDFRRTNSSAAEQRKDYDTFLSNLPADMAEKSRIISDFIAGQFAKEITPNEFDYMISAIYTNMITYHRHAAGVMYPSVRTEGDGFNVAIHPEYIDNGFLIPILAGECTIYKNGENVFVDNDTIALIEDINKDLDYKPVEAKYHAGRENSLKLIM